MEKDRQKRETGRQTHNAVSTNSTRSPCHHHLHTARAIATRKRTIARTSGPRRTAHLMSAPTKPTHMAATSGKRAGSPSGKACPKRRSMARRTSTAGEDSATCTRHPRHVVNTRWQERSQSLTFVYQRKRKRKRESILVAEGCVERMPGSVRAEQEGRHDEGMCAREREIQRQDQSNGVESSTAGRRKEAPLGRACLVGALPCLRPEAGC
eukprot:2373726-Rhodomonas_salina.1